MLRAALIGCAVGGGVTTGQSGMAMLVNKEDREKEGEEEERYI